MTDVQKNLIWVLEILAALHSPGAVRATHFSQSIQWVYRQGSLLHAVVTEAGLAAHVLQLSPFLPVCLRFIVLSVGDVLCRMLCSKARATVSSPSGLARWSFTVDIHNIILHHQTDE